MPSNNNYSSFWDNFWDNIKSSSIDYEPFDPNVGKYKGWAEPFDPNVGKYKGWAEPFDPTVGVGKGDFPYEPLDPEDYVGKVSPYQPFDPGYAPDKADFVAPPPPIDPIGGRLPITSYGSNRPVSPQLKRPTQGIRELFR